MNGKTITRALIPATCLSFVAVAAALSQDLPPAAPGAGPGGDVTPPPAAPAPILREAVFRYDGQLTWEGQPFTGMVNLEFRLFDDLAAGALVGQPLFADAYQLFDGRVTTDLDFEAMLVAGQPYWLEVTVNGTALLPRQKIVLNAEGPRAGILGAIGGEEEAAAAELLDDPKRRDLGGAANVGSAGASSKGGKTGLPDLAAPPGSYAPPVPPDGSGGDEGGGGGGVAGGGGWLLNGTSLFYNGGNVGIGTAVPVNKLDVIAVSGANQTRAILGRATAGSGITIGISGQSDSVNGRGIFGVATAPVGPTIGLFGLANSKNGIGLFGLANASTGETTGVVAQSTSPDGFGIRALGARNHFDGRVGIGTKTPDGSLHVLGVGAGASFHVYDFGPFDGMQLVSEWKGNANGAQVRFSGAGGGFIDIGQNSAGGFVVEGSDVPRFVVEDGGNVGIGTTAPSSVLHINAELPTNFRLADFTASNDVQANEDVLQLRVGSGSVDDMQFIECERGGDFKFRVWGDGDVTADGTFSGPADFAEMLPVTGGPDGVEPGDVLVIDVHNDGAVMKSQTPRSTLVAGIYSTKPGFLGSEHDWDKVALDLLPQPDDSSEPNTSDAITLGRMLGEVPMAIVGIVPCKVSAENGPILPGDLLVTSSTPGHAMRDENPRTGTIVGKALGEHRFGNGVIKVLVTLQ